MSETNDTQAAPSGEKKKVDTSLIDAAIARAKAQQAAKTSGGGSADAKTKVKAPKEPKPAKEPKVKAEKEPKPAKEPRAEKGPSHLKKVEAAAASLPVPDEATAAALATVKGLALSSVQLTTLATHLGFAARLLQTSAAVGAARPEVGQSVRIVSGDRGASKFVGMTGTLAEVRNIRCFVDVRDSNGNVVKKGLYLFISDVEVIAGVDLPDSDEPTSDADETETTAEETSTVNNDPTTTEGEPELSESTNAEGEHVEVPAEPDAAHETGPDNAGSPRPEEPCDEEEVSEEETAA
jgi:hypothetical protein